MRILLILFVTLILKNGVLRADCPNVKLGCYIAGGYPVGNITVGSCWHGIHGCDVCDWNAALAKCKSTYKDCDRPDCYVSY